MKEKKCSKCGKRAKHTASYCKECVAAYQKVYQAKYYAKNKGRPTPVKGPKKTEEEKRAYFTMKQRERRAKVRAEKLAAKTAPIAEILLHSNPTVEPETYEVLANEQAN